MRVLRPPKEIQVVEHVKQLNQDDIKQLQLVHYGYVSSKVYPVYLKHLVWKIPYVEFSMALETKGQQIQFATYRSFGSLISPSVQLCLGQRIYIRCIPVNDGKEKWFFVLEYSPADKLTDFPKKYKEYLAPDKLNRIEYVRESEA